MRPLAPILAATLMLIGCPKKEEPKDVPAAAAKPPPAGKTAEVEFFGKFSPGQVKAASSMFIAMQEPCSPVPAEVHLYGQSPLTTDKLFAEFFPPQGAVGHLCAYGLDADGKVVGVAAYAQNPVTFQGDGEVIFGNVDLILEALPEARSAPKGLTR